MRSINPNDVILKDVVPLIEVLRQKEEQAKAAGKNLMYFAYCEARHLLEDAPVVGAAEFIHHQTGKTIRELSDEMSLTNILYLIDKLYYENDGGEAE